MAQQQELDILKDFYQPRLYLINRGKENSQNISPESHTPLYEERQTAGPWRQAHQGLSQLGKF